LVEKRLALRVLPRSKTSCRADVTQCCNHSCADWRGPVVPPPRGSFPGTDPLRGGTTPNFR
jgi:hypothetical protein